MSIFENNTVGSDVLTQELASARPRLRRDLLIKLLTYDEHPWYLIEDPLRGKYYRIGAVEYVFLSALDGRTLAEVIAVTASQCGPSAFSEDEATSLCRWLIDADLIETDASRSFARLVECSNQQSKLSRRAWLNPLMLKIPLFDPQPLVGRMSDLLGWLISLPMLTVWCVVCGAAGLTFLSEFERFHATVSHVIDPNNWLWLCITWIGLKCIHESAHALACQRFGGRVRECGVLFLLFIPMPYVDVSSSWRFSEKWERIVTAAAGMLAEFFIAALAIFIWTNSTSPIVQQHAMNVIISATLVTMFFNANPLMRFDGYYILTDWLELPNLATRARAEMRGWQRQFFFGLINQKQQRNKRYSWLVRLYAVASSIWMITVTISIAIAAANLLPGIGLLLALISVGLWLVPALLGLLKFLMWGSKHEQPGRIRFLVVCGLLISSLWWIGEHAPAPQSISAPMVLEHDNLRVIRNRVGGVVQKVHVQQGTTVKQGDILLELCNAELQSESQLLNVSIKQSEMKRRNLIENQETATAQVESENLSVLSTRRIELDDLLQALLIVAESDGEVLSSNLDELPGVYFRPGSAMMEIANAHALNAIAMLNPEDVKKESHVLSELSDQAVRIRIWGIHKTVTGQFEHLTPTASDRLPHPALGAACGGPLAVKPTDKDSQTSANAWSLIQPKVEARIRLEYVDHHQASHPLRTGQTGVVTFSIHRGTLRNYITNSAWDWWTSRFQAQHGL